MASNKNTVAIYAGRLTLSRWRLDELTRTVSLGFEIGFIFASRLTQLFTNQLNRDEVGQ